MNNELIIKIKSLFPNLTKSEKKVALYINQHFDQILYLSIGDLASQCAVGETTILRFCKHLGFSGYYELKQKAILLNEKNKKNANQDENITIRNINTMVKDTIQLVDEKQLEKVAKEIIKSETVYVFGSGFSGLTAKAARMRLTAYGYKCIVADDKYLQILSANMMGQNDIALGLSISGENSSTIESIALAKQNGSKIIAITNYEESSLAKMGDIVLLTAGQEMGREGSTLVTEMSQLIVLEALFEKLHQLDKERIDQMNYKVSYYIRGE
ncbi:MurR/RpiR family transcriptional regulator [Candidatus Stoquefichus massiliensis]|uniref:MurR/RpiR family transcriptional regulator n=1 Tax=Candidatus Stoquefichus massiliensis TaxID=1470350 RepID=UPI0004800E8B|nr:MurR/RpiR family transcriptional regulator [Candidatus Stoquefichus massiliensis]